MTCTAAARHSSITGQPIHSHVRCAPPPPNCHLQEDAAALVRSNPAILSWNTSTLLNRITVVWQSLRLPPELREVLLTRPHRPLLSHSADIPHRLEFLKEYLGMPGVSFAACTSTCRCLSSSTIPFQQVHCAKQQIYVGARTAPSDQPGRALQLFKAMTCGGHIVLSGVTGCSCSAHGAYMLVNCTSLCPKFV